MSCLSRVSSYTAAIFGRASHLTSRTASHQCSSPSWKRSFERARLRTVNLEFLLPISRAQCYSSKKATVRAPRKKKSDPDPQVMEQVKDDFYVMRKGDLVGVYKNFTDCQAQVGTSICDPPVSVYKGDSLPKGTEEYLLSRGLQNALYTIRAADLKEDLFGTLVPCPIQQPPSSGVETDALGATNKRSHESLGSLTMETDVLVSDLTDPLRKHAKLDIQSETQAVSYDPHSCTLEFDGASKGNPGPAGAGVLLRAADGSVICRLREGLGITTNNVAEYRAMILGLKCALEKGYTKISVQGDSKLVCSQVQGLWKARQENISKLYEQAKELKDRFLSFHISHIRREFNSEADAEANLAVNLADISIANNRLKMSHFSALVDVIHKRSWHLFTLFLGGGAWNWREERKGKSFDEKMLLTRFRTLPSPSPSSFFFFKYRFFSLTPSAQFPSPSPSRTDVVTKATAELADIDDDEEDLLYPDTSVSSTATVATVPTLLQPRVVVYDGVCHLCHRGVKWVIEADKYRKIKFCCLQSKAAEPYLRYCGLEQEDVLRRFVFIEGPGLYHQASTAALRVVSYLPLPYSALSAFSVVPTPLRDAVYDYIAKRRYDWFGKADSCLVLKETELLERFIDRDEMMRRD
ncbi:uncharacterized protein [Euphorbia lathyris]|uniref:uncharacterized protein n=1 Tax=Euphorbia lathyris TaxID=212925 RepID=UPI003313D9C0